MAAHNPEPPKNGPSRALLDADPDESFATILGRVTRYECTHCGEHRFTRPTHCKECGCDDFETVTPEVEHGGE